MVEAAQRHSRAGHAVGERDLSARRSKARSGSQKQRSDAAQQKQTGKRRQWRNPGAEVLSAYQFHMPHPDCGKEDAGQPIEESHGDLCRSHGVAER